MCDQLISKEGQCLVLLSFSADKLLAETGARTLWFVYIEHKLVCFTASQKSDP